VLVRKPSWTEEGFGDVSFWVLKVYWGCFIDGNYGYNDMGKKASALFPAIKRPGSTLSTSGILI
jgi:hypothetical protein